MALSAYFRESPLEHIVSITINVAGATFVVKTYEGEIFYGRAEGSAEQSEDWFQWPEPFDLFGAAFANSGSSSALIKEHDADPGKPVWVVSAYKEEEATGKEGGVILYSEDGAAWDLVFERYPAENADDIVPWIIEPTGIVWDEDEQAFYASFYTEDFHQSGESGEFVDTPQGEEIYRSADGRSWTLVSRNLHLTGSEDISAVASDLAAHCKKPENENRGGGSQKIPDGLQGYNTNTGTFIKPAGLVGFDPYNGARYSGLPSPTVTRIDDKGISSTVSVGVINCYAVAWRNNVWVAVGGDPTVSVGGTFIDVSFDDGQTWASVFQSSTTSYAATVSGQGASAT